MQHTYTDQYKRVKLRPLQYRDIECLRILRNKEDNRKCFFYSEVISEEQQQKWFTKYEHLANDYMFTICRIIDDSFIGALALYNLDRNDLTAEFGRIIIDKDYVKEKGIGLEAINCVLNIAFNQLGLKTVYLEVFDSNKRAINVYIKAGFTIKHKYRKMNRDILYMEITSEMRI